MDKTILIFSKFMRLIGQIFIRLSHIDARLNRSIFVEKGRERDLYKTRFSEMFWLNKNIYLDQCIIRDGYFEKASTNATLQLVKKGDIVLDIGANIGYYSVLLAKLVGPNGRVLSFEPTKYFGQVLKKNLEANNSNNIEIFNLGLSDKEQELEIHIDGPSATLHDSVTAPHTNSEIIKLVPLDDFIKELDMERLDFIKIDVDGHEPFFFLGSEKTLEKFNPIILLEVSHLHYLRAGFTAWDFYDFLKIRNYKIYHEVNLTEINTKEDFLIKCGNFSYSTNIVISRKNLIQN